MSCFFCHLKDILDEAGITVTPANKKQVDQAFHQIVGVVYKDCPSTWKALKLALQSDDLKRRELIQKLQAALPSR